MSPDSASVGRFAMKTQKAQGLDDRKVVGGFTLIELLIVVAIIGILTAIAVPNFLDAQIRSKVSRVRADHHALAIAFESYHVDHNAYPPIAVPPRFVIFTGWWLDGTYQLTTPVDYINTASTRDPFPKPDRWPQTDPYQTNSYVHYDLTNPIMYRGYVKKNMYYMLNSFGPGKDIADEGLPWGFVPYDSTNGLVSIGHIMYYGPAGTLYFYAGP